MYIEKNTIDFEADVIEASKKAPILVDFWAEWCGPCHMLSPTLEKLANEAGEDWTMLKLNTELQQDMAIKYNIRSIPNVKLFIDGEVAGEFVGALPEADIKHWLSHNIPSSN